MMMFGKEEKEASLWTIVGEGNAHRMYGKKRMIRRSGETVTNSDGDEEEEEERFLLRRRKRRKQEDSCTPLSSLSSSFDRFVWSNGRERDADDERSVLQRDVRFALGQLCAGCAGGTIQTKEAGNILFSEQQRLRVKWNTSLVRAESGFFERIDAREKKEKRRLMRSDFDEEEVAGDGEKSDGEEKAPRFAIRERDYDWIPFYFRRRKTSTTTSTPGASKRKRSLNVGRTIHALAIEIKPKCGFTFREDGKLRYDVKTNAEDGIRGKKSAYDPRKFFEHCEIWSFADGVDYEALKKQLVRELEHMIETPRNTFRVREAKTGEVLWDATKIGSNAKRSFSNVVSEAFAGKVSLKELLELIVTALQQDGALKRLIRAQKYGRMANAYDYFGPDEEEIAMRRLAPKSIRRAHDAVLESYKNDTDDTTTTITKQKQLKDAFEICQDAILSAIAKDASIILAVRLIPGGGIHRRLSPPSPRRKSPSSSLLDVAPQEQKKYDAYDRSMDIPRGSGEMKDGAPRFAVSVNICDVGLKSAWKIPQWAELDS